MVNRAVHARRSVWPLATGAAAVTFFIYLRTLAPGLVGIVDTPKFQFIGKVLGVAHNPGYPLYSVLTHLFGYVPIGSLAYRINLFSAVGGAIAVALFGALMRQAGVRPSVAFVTAIAFGLGRTFWQAATIAEVYTLHLVLVAFVTLALFRWGRAGHPADFFLAIAGVAIGLGHHTTIVLIVPGIVLYTLLKDWRFATRPRTLVVALALIAAGFAQYAFVVLRSGAYSESPVSNLRELAAVISGAQFADLLVVQSLPATLSRLAYLVSSAHAELTVAGLTLAGVGALVLWSRDPLALTYLLSGIAAVTAFGVLYIVADIHMFLLPAFFMLWVLAAYGAERVVRAVSNRRAIAVVATAVFAVLPAVQYTANIGINDLSRRWKEARYLDSLIRTLPERSALLREDFLVDRMVLYEVLGEDSLKGRDILAPIAPEVDRVARLHESGYRIFAFGKTANAMRADGAEFSYAPLPVSYGSLQQFVEDLPDGTHVAMAIPALHFPPLVAASSAVLPLIGAGVPAAGIDRISLAIVGRRGERRPVVKQARHGAATVTPDGTPAITAVASETTAAIQLGTREVIRSHEGAVVAIWSARGDFQDAFVVSSSGDAVFPSPGPLAVFELRRLASWIPIGEQPEDISAAASSGYVIIRFRGAGAAEFELEAERPMAPVIMNAPGDGRDLLSITDGFAAGGSPSRRHTYRLTVKGEGGVIEVALGGVPGAGRAWAHSGSVELRGVDLSTHLQRIDHRTRRLHMARDHQEALVGPGWSALQVDREGPFRRMEASEAALLLPTAGDWQSLRLVAQLRPRRPREAVTLVFNGHDLGSRVLDGDWNRRAWLVPPDIVRSPISVLTVRGNPGTELADVTISSDPGAAR